MVVELPHAKYSGSGNSFFLIDNRDGLFVPDPGTIQTLCEKETDGLILLENSLSSQFRMRIFNADGSEAEMCGNGVRCLMQFICDLQLEKGRCTIETLAGEVVAESVGNAIRVHMPRPHDLRLNQRLDGLPYQFINTGVPHVVFFVEEIENPFWMELAPTIRRHSAFAPKGTNVNFAQLKDGQLWLRTYERGVEGETLACGTGATATALAAASIFQLPSPIHVIPRSQEILTVEFNPSFTQVALVGSAARI